MSSIQKEGNVLNELLGLCPGDAGAPEKIWSVLSERLGQTNGVVTLVFTRTYEDETKGRVSLTYFKVKGRDLELSKSQLWAEIKMDCFALDRLGFDSLSEYAG
jgi:hypothetical protein